MIPQRQEMIREKIIECMRSKFNSYRPETTKKPFHYRLIGKDRMAVYSFIHSLNTTFGMSIYEQVAISLARDRFKRADSQVNTYSKISTQAHQQIQTIINRLGSKNKKSNKLLEIKEIRGVCQDGTLEEVDNLPKVDVWLENHDNQLYLFDFKTVKPNKSNFKDFKRTLLEWTAAEFARDPDIDINTMIGVPYNPYEPKPYRRWTLEGMLDLQHDIL
ncbi:TdeIII family type II restriction endonuclease [Candidatus Poribacteria bacterium]|nr:TdeIII family type II restriction endonuclease [Candidatus Poribacteria bacterium]